MRNLNFLVKFFLAFFLFAFALWYGHITYNLIIGLIIISILIKDKISPFRFRRQIFIFSTFLVIIFIFQSFNGYGKILLSLPFHLILTEEGILTAFKFVTQILLIFLLFGTAIYSTKKQEIFYYFSKPLKSHAIVEQKLEGLFRIGFFSFYMVPNSLKIQSHFSNNVKFKYKTQKMGIRQRVSLIFENIYLFVKAIIKNSEEEYPDFVIQSKRSAIYSPEPVITIKNGLILLFVLSIHGLLIWLFS